MRTKKQGWPLSRKVSLFTLHGFRCYLMSLEAGAVLWQGWKQYSAGKSSRAQGKKVSERKKFYTGFLSSRHQAQMLFTSVCSSSHYSPQGLRSPLKTYQGI